MNKQWRDWNDDWLLSRGKVEASIKELQDALAYWLDKYLEEQQAAADAMDLAYYWFRNSPLAQKALRETYEDEIPSDFLCNPTEAVEFLAHLLVLLHAELRLKGDKE